MAQIEWSEGLSVGVPSLDEQHKRLIFLTDVLFTSIMEDRGPEVVADVLRQLEEYATYHFRYEEELMVAHAYPDFAAHVAEHAGMLRRVREYLEAAQRDPALLDIVVYDFLRNWTVTHLEKTDMRCGAFLVRCGVR
ncbi:MAG: bacteriohemerythrin [Desulfovibrionaceae bacterium]